MFVYVCGGSSWTRFRRNVPGERCYRHGRAEKVKSPERGGILAQAIHDALHGFVESECGDRSIQLLAIMAKLASRVLMRKLHSWVICRRDWMLSFGFGRHAPDIAFRLLAFREKPDEWYEPVGRLKTGLTNSCGSVQHRQVG